MSYSCAFSVPPNLNWFIPCLWRQVLKKIKFKLEFVHNLSIAVHASTTGKSQEVLRKEELGKGGGE